MRKLSVLVVTLLIFVVACGPSVEGELKAWEKNSKSVESFKNEFPAYAQLIDYKFSEAQKVWDAAQSIGDEDQKAEKMQEANNFFEQGSLSILRSLKSDISSLKREKEKLLGTTLPNYTFTSSVNNAVSEANNAINLAEQALYETSQLSKEEAETKLSRVGVKLNDANSLINNAKDKIARYVREQKAKEKQTQTQNQNTTSNSQSTIEKKASTVKCEYCGTINDASNTKCKSCGATLPSK